MFCNYVNAVIKGVSCGTQTILGDLVNKLYTYYYNNQTQLGNKNISAVESGLKKGFEDIFEYVDKFGLSMEKEISGTEKNFMNELKNALYCV